MAAFSGWTRSSRSSCGVWAELVTSLLCVGSPKRREVRLLGSVTSPEKAPQVSCLGGGPCVAGGILEQSVGSQDHSREVAPPHTPPRDSMAGIPQTEGQEDRQGSGDARGRWVRAAPLWWGLGEAMRGVVVICITFITIIPTWVGVHPPPLDIWPGQLTSLGTRNVSRPVRAET